MLEHAGKEEGRRALCSEAGHGEWTSWGERERLIGGLGATWASAPRGGAVRARTRGELLTGGPIGQ